MGDRLGLSETSFNFRYFQISFSIKESFQILVQNLLMTLSIAKCYSTGKLYLSLRVPAKALNSASAVGFFGLSKASFDFPHFQLAQHAESIYFEQMAKIFQLFFYGLNFLLKLDGDTSFLKLSIQLSFLIYGTNVVNFEDFANKCQLNPIEIIIQL